MIYRPVDENGDILPVRASADLLRDTPAAARLVRDRLSLYTGEWWENPAWGNEILEMLTESRLTETDRQALAAYLSSFIRETPGVRDVREVSAAAEGCRFCFECVIDTDSGSESIRYE